MNFDVVGPFELTRDKKIINKKSVENLKQQLDVTFPGLSGARGCYVFAMYARKRYTPYYVGQACRQSIVAESMNPSNREKYTEVCHEKNGKPMMFVLPMLTPDGKYKKKGKTGRRATDFLERWLIATAIRKNPKLLNNKETKFLRGIHVRGIFNPKRGEANGTSSQKLKKVLW